MSPGAPGTYGAEIKAPQNYRGEAPIRIVLPNPISLLFLSAASAISAVN